MESVVGGGHREKHMPTGLQRSQKYVGNVVRGMANWG